MIEQAKFSYCPLGKALQKQKQDESQGENKIKAIEEHGKQLAESNAFIRKYDFNIDTDD